MRYNYKAISSTGKIKKGFIEDTTREELIYKLEKENYYLMEFTRDVSKIKVEMKVLKDINISLLFNQIYILLDSGIPIKEALIILKNEDFNQDTNDILVELLEGLDRGVFLSETLERANYPNLIIALLKSGEESGNMSLVFSQISEYYKKRYLLKQKIIGDLIYPFILIISTFFLTIFIFTNIFPEIIQLFDFNNQELPLLTNLLIDFNTYISINKYKIIFVVSFFVLIMIYIYKKRTYYIQKLLFDSLIFSKYIKLIYSLTFLETYKLMLKSGLSLIQSIEISNDIISNAYVHNNIKEIIIEVERGKSFSELLKNRNIFPVFVTSMIKLGEESGEMIPLTSKAIEYLEQELKEFLSRIVKFIEPVLLLFISIVIGIILMAFITPMFEITNFIY